MTNKIRICTLVAALAAAPLFAAYEDVTLEKYPDADVVMLDGLEDTVYNADGTYVTIGTQAIKVLTEKGRREESELVLRYSSRYGRAAILWVKVTGADGVEREVDVAATTKDSTDNSSASENIYDPMHRKLVCTIPGVKVGDIITYQTRIEVFTSRIKDQWSTLSVLEWQCPILRQEIRITCPRERPLKKVAVRHGLGNVEYSEKELPDGRLQMVWVSKDSAQMFEEPDMPPTYTQVQNLRVSTAENWEEISRWYWDISVPHLEKTNAAITNKVMEIGADVEARGGDRMALLRAIYKWVAQEVRYMGLTMEDASPGYSPHDVDITFDNRYGVCRDKAALLVVMLRIAGFEAYPVLIHAGAKMDPEIPSPYFNHAVASVVAPEGSPEKYILLDPTDESSRDLMPAYLSDRSYLVARPDGETLRTSPVPGARENAVSIESEATLARDGSMVLESKMAFGGINDNVYRQTMLRRKKEAQRKLFERIVAMIAPGAEILDFEVAPENLQDTSKPLEVRLSARLPEAVVDGTTCIELMPPLLSRAIGTANWILDGKTSLESRKYPLVIDSTAMVEERLKVKLGDAVGRVVSLPGDYDLKGDYEYYRHASVSEDGEVLTIERRAAVNAVEMSPEAYRQVRERMKEAEAAERERPMFARRRLSGANVRTLSSREDVWTSSAFDWVVTNTVSRQILTYDGKKKYSELTFQYNPTWKDVEIVSAVVSNRDGKVTALSEREMNEFDCAWAASAPRYPATRELVVNLPGVEVGSVITYQVATTVTNAPAAFYGSWAFDSTEPADEIVVSLNGEERRREYAPVIPTEPMTAEPELWRDRWTVSSNDFKVAAKALREAADVEAYSRKDAPWGADVKSIRDWMAKNVRVAGPSLYEVPLAAQRTDVETVLAERYASRLDYIRTLCSLLRGAGYCADIVFASTDAATPEELRKRDMGEMPNVRAFALPLCRVRERVGGFFWFFGKTRTTYLGTENEYAPLGATGYAHSHFLDPRDASFGVVEPSSPEFESRFAIRTTMTIRDDGAADFDVSEEHYGPEVAAFRKRYEEMLPEDRQRHYQERLGKISQAATATRELATDTQGYPAKLSFSAYAPDWATFSGDLVTVAVPEFYQQLFPLSGSRRENPIGVEAADRDETVVEVVFPKGYDMVEHLPSGYEFHDPATLAPWFRYTVETGKTEDGRLKVTLTRTRAKREYAFLAADYAALLRDWSRIGSSRANRAIIVRRTGGEAK